MFLLDTRAKRGLQIFFFGEVKLPKPWTRTALANQARCQGAKPTWAKVRGPAGATRLPCERAGWEWPAFDQFSTKQGLRIGLEETCPNDVLEMAKRDAEAAKKKQEEDAKIAKKAAAVQEKIDDKQEGIADIEGERVRKMQKSNEALQANDIRSGEGMSQFLALASGREDPAIAEYRKQTQKLEEMKAELRALQQEKVEILGGANN
jgi:hypothetical protein